MIIRAAAIPALLLLVVAAPTLANPDSDRRPTGMLFASGRCDSLSIDGGSVACGTTVFSVLYDDGRRSIAVKGGDGLVSFFGHLEGEDLVVEMVTGVRKGDDGEARAVSQPATGRCTPAILAAKTRFSCNAAWRDGRQFALVFTTNDQPPSGNDLGK